ncbi:MAG TPA: hypothetical protein VFU63_06975 [Ktedonobacterales bacterium]|nr:hypothetical protein [Ktedonobacterales bacterium]
MLIQRKPSHSSSAMSLISSASDQTISAESHQREIAALQQEIETLRAAHQQELALLRTEMVAQVVSLRNALTPAPSHTTAAHTQAEPVTASDAMPVVETDAQPENHADAAETATSRRTLLKWGGLAAAAGLAAAGGATLTSPAAHASDGNSLVLGQVNLAEHATTLTYDGSESNPVVLQVSTTVDNGTAISASAGVGSNAGGIGVYGAAGDGSASYGIFGVAGTDGNGVYGYASNPDGYGVLGTTDSGYGVVGISGTGVDLLAAGSGRIWQQFSSFTGAPKTGSYAAGEQIRDGNGDLYLCIAGGTPGTWKKVASLNTSYTGGAIGFLSTPIRVYDSRKTGGKLIGNAARNIQVTGLTIGGVQVPKGATGCIGNLTAVGPSAGGYLVIYPAGSSAPSTSTVNFVTNQTVPNSFAVGLSSSGQVTVHSFTSGSVHFIVDITGFVA